MEYKEIIQRNSESLARTGRSWWPYYVYHYTDVRNAVSILKSGILYSRSKAIDLSVMQSDNASRQVIDMTNSRAITYARFYFRPLTPTQYYNEGFKHPDLRFDGDINANVPVPIFLLFDAESVLSTSGTMFSSSPQSGHGSPLESGVDAFARLPFHDIYSDGPSSSDQRRHRHAEVVYPTAYLIKNTLKYIMCRNAVERSTLLTLLSQENKSLFDRYSEIIKISNDGIFLKNGMFINDFNYSDGTAAFDFNEDPQKSNYQNRMMQNFRIEKLRGLKCQIRTEWLDKHRQILKYMLAEATIDYNISRLTLNNISHVDHSTLLRFNVKIEDKLVCIVEHSLRPSDIL